MRDPLETLLDSLRAGRGVPFDWVVEHAADGKLGSLWVTCRNADTLLGVYGYTGDRVGYVLAALACAREALPYIGEDYAFGLEMVAVIEKWTRDGEVPDSFPSSPFETQAVYALEAAYRAIAALPTSPADSAAEFAANAAADDVEAFDRVGFDEDRWKRAQARELRRLAKIVRKTLRAHGRKPPTVAQLTEKRCPA